MEEEGSNSTGSVQDVNMVSHQLPVVETQPQLADNNLKSVPKTSESSIVVNETSVLSWPSLWKNGPRRSAFQPYKPSRKPATITRDPTPPLNVERPASAAALTNLQRGNTTTAVGTPTSAICWFTRAGRGDLTAEQLEQMLAQGDDIDRVDDSGLSALMWASFYGQIHTVELLLTATDKLISSGSSRGMNVNRVTMWGETALSFATTGGHLEITRILLDAGANIDHQDFSGNSAVMCAVAGDHVHTLRELLIQGADPWLENDQGHTAYDIAAMSKAHKSRAVLEKHMVETILSS